MSMGVPRERGDAVAEPDAVVVQGPGARAGPAADLAVIRPVDGTFHRSAHDFPVAMIERGVVDDLVHQQRPVLHQTKHAQKPLNFPPHHRNARRGEQRARPPR
jgi:hypothetical protein